MTGEDDLSDVQRRARKVKPQFGEGALVKVAWAPNQAEAELIAGLLLEEGVPSMLRRTRGFDVPEMLAAGPRDVLVPQSGYAVAREVLLKEGMLSPDEARRSAQDRPGRVLAGLLGAVALVGLVVWLGNELLRM